MKRVLIFLLAIFLTLHYSITSLHSSTVAAQETTPQDNTDQQTPACSLPELRTELLERVERDQQARQQMIDAMQGDFGPNATNDPEISAAVTKVDQENREWLKTKIDEHGWPGKTLVDTDGAHAAWLIAQHADMDREFQRRCLDMMAAMPADEVERSDIAYLTDRVLAAEGKPGRYGTQLAMVDGHFATGNVEDPENLDTRRAEVGLMPMARYLREAEIGYGIATPTFDHHVHLLSPALLADWKSVGMEFSRADENYTDPDLALQNVGTDRAVAVSMAHLYGSEWFADIERVTTDEAAAVSAENDYIARCVEENKDGAWIGFFSANPLRDYAMPEYKRCLANKHLSGLKLHLPINGVDLRNAEHLEKLKTVFAWCAENEVPILIHLAWADVEDFGVPAANRFWSELIAPHPSLRLIIAHLGASGGFNENSTAIINGYLELRQRHPEFENAEIYFDLSGAILSEETDGLPPTSDEQCQVLAKMMREVGLQRFLPASDYPALSPQEMKQTLFDRLPLEKEEIESLLLNMAPFLKTDE